MNSQNFLPTEKKDYKKHALTFGQGVLIFLRIIPYFLISALLLIIIVGVAVGISLAPRWASLQSGYDLAMQGQTNLLQAEQNLKDKDLKATVENLTLAKDNFQEANSNLKIAGQAFVFRSQLIKDQLEVAENILDIGEITSQSLLDLVEVGEEAQAVLKSNDVSWLEIDQQKKEKVLKILNDSVSKLDKTKQDIDLVEAKLKIINKKNPLFVFNKALDPLQKNLPKIKKSFDQIITASKLLPAFSGYPEEKTYLFILENNREMRPAGGFIGTYGILKIKNAEIVDFFTDNSYNLDQPSEEYLDIESPAPMAKYMNQPKWYFRDSNWWPDFPTSALKAVEFYELEGGKEKFDGVIAITPTVIENMLTVLGEFNINDLLFNKNNFWEQLQYEVEFGYYPKGIDVTDRKDIISDLGKTMISRLFSLPMSQWGNLADIISEQVKENHILVYFNDENLQKQAVENKFAGEVKNTKGDYVMLVDANLAALKTDEVMQRTMKYNLNEQNDYVTSTVKVDYQNMGTFSWKTTRYRSYSRLYVPAGSELISVKVGNKILNSDEVDIYNEFGKTAFGLFFEVEPQTTKTVEWQYKLPNDIKQQINKGDYNLYIQKQAGIIKMNLQLDLNFQKNIWHQNNQLSANSKNIKHVEVLRSDQEFNVWLQE